MENFEPKPQTPNTTDNQPAAMPEANTAAEKTMQPPTSAPAENNGNAAANVKEPEPQPGMDAPPAAAKKATPAAEAKAEASVAPEKQAELKKDEGAPTPAVNPAAAPVLPMPPNGVPPYMAYLPKGPSLSKRVREAVLTADNGHKAVGLFAGALVICLFLANTLLNTGGAGFFFPFCVVLLYGLFYAFTGFDKLWESREALAMQIFIFLLSLGFLYNQESLTNTVTFLTLLAAVPLHLMYCTGKSDPVEDGARVIRKAFLAVFSYTFGNFDVPYKKLFKGMRRGSKGQGVLFTVLGLVCTIPFLVILTYRSRPHLHHPVSYHFDPAFQQCGLRICTKPFEYIVLFLRPARSQNHRHDIARRFDDRLHFAAVFCAGCRLPAARSGQQAQRHFAERRSYGIFGGAHRARSLFFLFPGALFVLKPRHFAGRRELCRICARRLF